MRLHVEALRGEIFICTGTMNSGKTEDLILTSEGLMHSAYASSTMVFANSRNTRDGTRKLVSTGGLRLDDIFIADADNPDKINSTIEKTERDSGEQIVLLFDEVNLHSHKFIPVVKKQMDRNKLIVIYGLDLDFRGESFGPMGRLEEIARARESITGKQLISRFKSYCSVVKGDKQCGNVASNTLRLQKRRGSEQEVKYFDTERNLISSFTKAHYFGPTVIVEGSRGDIKYTTACQGCFGDLPGRDLVEDVLSFVTNERETTYEKIFAAFMTEADLSEVLAYGIEEKKLDINGGRYSANINSDHPTWDEAITLSKLGKDLDSKDANTTIEVYRALKNSRTLDRSKITKEFESVNNIERILSGLMRYGLIKLEDATFTPTPYIRDAASGMYIPLLR